MSLMNTKLKKYPAHEYKINTCLWHTFAIEIIVDRHKHVEGGASWILFWVCVLEATGVHNDNDIAES